VGLYPAPAHAALAPAGARLSSASNQTPAPGWSRLILRLHRAPRPGRSRLILRSTQPRPRPGLTGATQGCSGRHGRRDRDCIVCLGGRCVGAARKAEDGLVCGHDPT
jgi:hypothetical protein